MTDLHVELVEFTTGNRSFAKDWVLAEITTAKDLPLTRNVLEGLVYAALVQRDGGKIRDLLPVWDYDSVERIRETDTERTVRVRMKRHDPKTDLFQRQPDGSYAVTIASLNNLAIKKDAPPE
jgi:hypothetical protein